MISSELVELRSLCDRIGIVSEGKLFLNYGHLMTLMLPMVLLWPG
jgi:ABC-type sugar transport system ATPase subunit